MYIDISIVIPLYNSGERIPLLYQSLINILSFYSNYEIIFVDDGSKDNTMEIIKGLREKDSHIRIAQLKEHMGQYETLFTGYKCSKGRIVISLDDDAFEEIDYIPEFIRKIDKGYDMVLGWREKNEYPLLRKITSFLFNLIISLIIGRRIHDIGSSLKAKNRKAVDRLVSLGELSYFLKYYKYYKFMEIRIPSIYSKKFSTRYNIAKLAEAAMLILKNNIYSKRKVQPDLCERHIEINYP